VFQKKQHRLIRIWNYFTSSIVLVALLGALLLGTPLIFMPQTQHVLFNAYNDVRASLISEFADLKSRLFSNVRKPVFNFGISPTLDKKLKVLAVGLENEIMLCLTGTRSKNRARVDDFFMPTHMTSQKRMVTVIISECPAKTIARWHNHPGEEKCYLSEIDVHAAVASKFLFTVVHSKENGSCWWSREQVIGTIQNRIGSEKFKRIDAIIGQFSGYGK